MSEGMEVLTFTDKDQRDRVFDRLREQGDPNEKQVVKSSGVEAEMISEEEFKLDAQGRIIYRSTFSLAYPKEPSGWKRLKEAARG